MFEVGFLLLSVALFAAVIERVFVVRDRDRRLEAAKYRMEDLVAVAKAEKERQQQVIADLRTELSRVREERHGEAQSYMERALMYENRISELIRQNQNLAERVASLRQAGLTDGGDDYHVEDAPAAQPYHPELQRLYDGLEGEAQVFAENFIERHRALDVADEEILRLLENEWSA